MPLDLNNQNEPRADIYTVNLPNDEYTYDLRDSRIDEKSGQPNGLAILDSNGKVPASELPEIGSDNVVDGYYYNGAFYEESTHITPITGADKIIYIDFHTDDTYRYDVTNQEYVKVGIHYSNATQLTDGLMSATDKEKLDGIDIVSVTVGVDEHSINIDNDDLVGLEGKVDKTSVGVANGVASLDSTGKVPSSQLPDLSNTFTGTTDEWNQLTTEQKKSYDIVNITDDYDTNPAEVEIWGFIDHMNILDPAQRIEYIKTNKLYTPLTIDSTTHSANYGSWEDNPILTGNIPAMIKSDGTLDYYLDPDDYTKKLDGTPSDVANDEYEGGAFAYIPKHYRYEYVKGNDRYVLISMTKVNNNYKAIGFTDHLGNEYDGMWIPMFYGTSITQNSVEKILSLGTGYPVTMKTISQEKTCIENGCSSAKFFGGPMINVLSDLLMLFSKNSNPTVAYGYGARSNSAGTTANGVVNGGQFYGTTDKTSLNKAFHSIVLLSVINGQHDPYTNIFSGRLKVSPGYYYDMEGTSQYTIDTEIDCPSLWIGYCSKFIPLPDYGHILDFSNTQGSESTGYGSIARCNGGNSVCCRNDALQGNIMSINLYAPNNGNVIGASPMIFGALSQ